MQKSDPISSTPSVSEGNHRFRFAEQATALGIEFTYRNGEEAGLFSIVESLGGGVGLLDYDRDGRLDLFALGGGTFDEAKQRATGNNNALYRNGGARFSEVAAMAHLLSPPFYTHGVAAADYNEDGFATFDHWIRWCRALYQHGRRDFRERHRGLQARDRWMCDECCLGGHESRWSPRPLYCSICQLVIYEQSIVHEPIQWTTRYLPT